jgi:hypothetical protein
MRKILFFLTLLISIEGFAKSTASQDLRSVHLLKNKYGPNCMEKRDELIANLSQETIEVVEEVIFYVQNEIMQEGIIRARDKDLKDLLVIWIKKYGVERVYQDPNILYYQLGAQERFIHSYRKAIEEIGGKTEHHELKTVQNILKS